MSVVFSGLSLNSGDRLFQRFFTAILLSVLLTSPLMAGPIPPAAEKQRQQFVLPAGFEIQLVVADPHIGQPMNMNFDAQGRLWITHTVEYPYPANGEGVEPRPPQFPGMGKHPPRDRVTVVSDITAEGRAGKIVHFAEGLNIPIGVTPLRDGNSAAVYGIPSIFHFEDTNQDGQADRKSTLYTRFGNVDVHGNASSFTRWIDGWIYGCHGFSNTSEVRDGSGNLTVMRSGNTYRFREDGSRFELFTHGQTNPFGLTFDPLGNLYSSDCHSMPVYLLLRGGRYPGLGAAHDRLGFGPAMIDHGHGSTGICGPAYYAASHFPPEYRDNLFICNPVTSRIHRDRLKPFGSTRFCDTQPDFLVSNDPWFRPVGAMPGPDGALYIADFCNLIIGHYEAPLDHPNRDRTHGRIWRVVWKGTDSNPVPPPAMPDLTTLTTQQLVEQLADENLLVRTLATNYLVDAHADSCLPYLQKILKQGEHAPEAQAHALWVQERLTGLADSRLLLLQANSSPLVRVHLMRALGERTLLTTTARDVLQAGLKDQNAFVQRAAVEALHHHPQVEQIPLLLQTGEQAVEGDTHLQYAVQLAVRHHLRQPEIVPQLYPQELPPLFQSKLQQLALVSETPAVIPLLLDYVSSPGISSETLKDIAQQVSAHGTEQQILQLVDLLQNGNILAETEHLPLFLAVIHGLEVQGKKGESLAPLTDWLRTFTPAVLESISEMSQEWTTREVPGLPASRSPWGIRQRLSADDKLGELFWDSIAGGEQQTGILSSPVFFLPEKLSFWLCGHNGHPDARERPVNHVRLVHADSGQILISQLPPGNDTATKHTWQLPEHAGQPVRLELVDAHRGQGWAWLAAGRFEPAVIQVTDAEQASRQRIENLALFLNRLGQLGLSEYVPTLSPVLTQRQRDDRLRIAALQYLERLQVTAQVLPQLMELSGAAEESIRLRSEAILALGRMDDAAATDLLGRLLIESAGEFQRTIAGSLCRTPAGVTVLLAAISKGQATAQLLQNPVIAAEIHRNANAGQQEQVATLLKNLPPEDLVIRQKITQQLLSFAAAVPDLERGREVFRKTCAVCHRAGQEGHLVGPQLDGIGQRGAERLLEDILDPGRNVDIAFRTTVFVTTAGKVLNGLIHKREGEVIIVIDSQGREHKLAGEEIEETQQSPLSLMPAGLLDNLNEQERHDLLGWLLSLRPVESQP